MQIRLCQVPLLVLLIGATTCLVGCVGGRGTVKADRTNVPISFSSALLDGQGKALQLGKELVPVGTFKHKAHSIGFIYSATSMDVDISEAVDTQVRAVGGEGICNLSIEAGHCPLNFFFPLNHLPFWPGCATWYFEGTIVRRGER